MTKQLDELGKGWYTWHISAAEQMANGLTDVRSYPALIRSGSIMYSATSDLAVIVDEVCIYLWLIHHARPVHLSDCGPDFGLQD